MKHILLLFSYLIYFSIQGQTVPAIKIYLEDAENGKNISDAKVTLEGFEIPAIVGQYNKKEKYYFFNQIPPGYNTIMAYHKKYNEKGFQDVSALPKELKLKLYDPLNVSYSFNDDPYAENTQSIYVEDPYKFAIFSDSILDYNIFKDYLIKEIDKLDLEIEIVNPYWELQKRKNIPYLLRIHTFNPKVSYPEVKTFGWLEHDDDFILPLKRGYSTAEFYNSDVSRSITGYDVAFYFRKKTGKKFKRFNDPILKKIRTIKGIISSSVIIDKFYFKDENENRRYKNSLTRKLDKRNRIKGIDSSKVFFYYNFISIDQRKNPKSDRLGLMNITKYGPNNNEILILYQKNIYKALLGDNSNRYYKLEKFSDCKKELFYIEAGTGLGILDQYEKITECSREFRFGIFDIQLYQRNLNDKKNEKLAH
jgi:hypothetical protein